MLTYVDLSALVRVYVPESFSAAARDAVHDARQVPSRSAECLRADGRAQVDHAGRTSVVLQQLKDDIDAQRLMPLALDLERLFADEGELSRKYSARFLARSLDLLHVVSANFTDCAASFSGR